MVAKVSIFALEAATPGHPHHVMVWGLET